MPSVDEAFCAPLTCRRLSAVWDLHAGAIRTPGILTTMHALLTEEPNADADRVREVLAGNICRCTGYIPIVEAVLAGRSAYAPKAATD